MKVWKTEVCNFISETTPQVRVQVSQLPAGGYTTEIKFLPIFPKDPAVLREWADVLQAVADQIDTWIEEGMQCGPQRVFDAE